MNPNTRGIIEEIASFVRTQYRLNDDNSNLEQIVDDLGGNITRLNILEDAYISKTQQGGFTITLKEGSSATRERFSIAHELGHLFLNMRYMIDEGHWDTIPHGMTYDRDTTIPFTQIELEANEFASELLMPRDTFMELAEQTFDGNYYYPESVATKLNVSLQAALVRGRILGIWR